MKNVLRRQVLALMLGVTTLAIASPLYHPAFAEDSHSGQDDSGHHDSASGDDGPNHDANDDHGGGDDDGPNHDANDDHSGGDDGGADSSSGPGNSDCAIASVNCAKKTHKS